MDRVVGRAGVDLVGPEQLERDRAGTDVKALAQVAGRAGRAQQRQRVEGGDLGVVGVGVVEVAHRLHVLDATLAVVTVAPKDLDRADEALLAVGGRLGDALLPGSRRAARAPSWARSGPCRSPGGDCRPAIRPNTPWRSPGRSPALRGTVRAPASRPKLCRIATPRRKWACASPVAEVGKVIDPTSSPCACAVGAPMRAPRIRSAADAATVTVVFAFDHFGHPYAQAIASAML